MSSQSSSTAAEEDVPPGQSKLVSLSIETVSVGNFDHIKSVVDLHLQVKAKQRQRVFLWFKTIAAVDSLVNHLSERL